MNKLIFSGSLLAVGILIFGSILFPTDSIMWLASTSHKAVELRGAIAAIILAVLFSSPPRKFIVRLAMGLIACTLVATSIFLIVSNSEHLLDIVMYLQLGCAFGLEALELNSDEIETHVSQLQSLQAQPSNYKINNSAVEG